MKSNSTASSPKSPKRDKRSITGISKCPPKRNLKLSLGNNSPRDLRGKSNNFHLY